MNNDEQIKGLVYRALVSRGHQRIADLREALRLAVESSGTPSRDMPATNNIPFTANPWGIVVTGNAIAFTNPREAPVTDNLTTIANLRDMLNDEGVKDNPRAIASIVRAIRQLQ